MCQHNLPCSIVYAHCLLPGRAFASLYVLLFLEKEAEIGGRALPKFANSLDPKDLRRHQGQTGIPRINNESVRPTLRPMPRKNIIEP